MTPEEAGQKMHVFTEELKANNIEFAAFIFKSESFYTAFKCSFANSGEAISKLSEGFDYNDLNELFDLILRLKRKQMGVNIEQKAFDPENL